MKKMKNIIIFLIALSLLMLSGCRYKEGPLISFKSVEKRILGYWYLKEYTCEGVDYLQSYYDKFGYDAIMWFYKEYHDASDYRVNFKGNKLSFSGHFNLSDNKTNMNVSFPQLSNIGPIGSGNSTWHILKLTNNKIRVSIEYNDKNYNIYAVKQ